MYNHESYIGRAIQSVLDQTFTDFELLIFDDQSTDRSVDVVKSFSDPRIKLFVNDKNLGPEGNWNLTLTHARGQYIKLLCGDDLLEPTCLERQVGVLDDPAHRDVVLVTSNKLVIDAKGKVITKRRFTRKATKLSGKEGVRKLLILGSNPFGEPGAGLFRADLIPKLQGYRARIPYVIDLDFWCQLLRLGNVYLLPDFLFSFRISSTSWSSRIGFLQYRQWVDFLNLLKDEKHFQLSRADVLLGTTTGAAQFAARMVFFKLFASH